MDANERTLAEALASECPAWSTGTILLRDEMGGIAGYGHIKRTGEKTAEITVSAAPQGASLLLPPPPRASV